MREIKKLIIVSLLSESGSYLNTSGPFTVFIVGSRLNILTLFGSIAHLNVWLRLEKFVSDLIGRIGLTMSIGISRQLIRGGL